MGSDFHSHSGVDGARNLYTYYAHYRGPNTDSGCNCNADSDTAHNSDPRLDCDSC